MNKSPIVAEVERLEIQNEHLIERTGQLTGQVDKLLREAALYENTLDRLWFICKDSELNLADKVNEVIHELKQGGR